ncbi:DUF6596 domain-containing protein [Pulveribacter sp.]|uniref:RNA polymerase sigma factor n=1 Tax=Pulveribacter sp. TaxID=2678893 RepID=UPI0028B0CA7B|nr:DUF6596 domain-containing protein [Pulveribacter sp.]
MPGADDAARQAIAAVWRIEAAKVVAHAARVVRDLGVAEELAQDVLVSALEHWPVDGIPNSPGAWLMAAVRRRALDHLRRQQVRSAAADLIAGELQTQQALYALDAAAGLDERRAQARGDAVDDEVLGLVFTACHPLLPASARSALTLKLVAGLSTAAVARAYLVSEGAMAQRLVRAQRTLAEAGVPFEVPGGEELPARLAAVLEVVYLIFNEGYAASEGDDWMRPALVDEALRLARRLAALVLRRARAGRPLAPADQAEVHGLAALLELQAARMPARTDARGRPVLLADQDRRRWDRLLLRRGLAALAQAEALAPARGPYTLQAAIAACHARAPSAAATDWRRIAGLYGALAARQPSPVVELNRAVAVGMAEGPAAGLAVLEPLRAEPALARYHWLPAVRADFLLRLGRAHEARAELLRAAALAGNGRERALLQERAQGLAGGA